MNEIIGKINTSQQILGKMNTSQQLQGDVKFGSYQSNDDYEKLKNIPLINNVELIGNKTSKQLKLQEEMKSISNLDIDKIFNL